ncbi:hypothetical protein QTP86_003418 [Hemibagrus guttatus]|nr:hypothetical protein QTP86_003418 [Hemibagrus guttatus]
MAPPGRETHPGGDVLEKNELMLQLAEFCHSFLQILVTSWFGQRATLSPQVHATSAFIDSGVDLNFIDSDFATRLGIQFQDLQIPIQLPVVLGITWLKQHNPHVDWLTGRILSWRLTCSRACLSVAPTVSERPSEWEEEIFPDLFKVPEVYLDLKEVFTGAGFFFVGKKDGGLRPCIDYRGLNQITIKNWYPLPLISSAFELLQEDVIFTKLDLCNAYHLMYVKLLLNYC